MKISTAGPARIGGATWPIAALVAVFIGLGGIGGAAGMALGAVGAASGAHPGGDHHHRGEGPGPRAER